MEELSGLTQATFTESLDLIKETIRQVIQGRDQLEQQQSLAEEAQAEKEEQEVVQEALDHVHDESSCLPPPDCLPPQGPGGEEVPGRESPHGSSKLRMVFTGDQLANAAETRVH